MKKRVLIAAAAVCLAMLLSGCSTLVEKLGERFFESEEEYSRPKSSSSSSQSSSSPSESAPHEHLSVDSKLLEAAYSNMRITMDISNSLSGTTTHDIADHIFEIYEVRDLLTDEYYEAVNLITKKYSSKREYVKEVLDSHPGMEGWFDEYGKLTMHPTEPKLFIEFSEKNDYNQADDYDPDTKKQAFMQAAEWIIGKLNGKLLYSIELEMKRYNFVVANVEYSINYANSIEVFAEIDLKEDHVILSDTLSFTNANGFMLGKCFVPYSTQKLAISIRDNYFLSLPTNDIFPNDCKIASLENGYYKPFDFAEIAKKLPDLKELYLYQAMGINREAIADMKNLEVLSYYVVEDIRNTDAIPECPFKELKNLRSLYLYADYDDYSFLSEMPQLTDIHIEADLDKHKLDDFFGYPAITSLKIYISNNKRDFSLDDIDKIKNLKKLEIFGSVRDLTPLGKLKELETLSLSYQYNCYDWSFLQQMDSLTDLSLHSVNGISNSYLAPLKQLKSLTVYNSGSDVSIAAELPELQSYTEIGGSDGDLSVFKNCRNLRRLILSRYENSVMDCSYIRDLPLEIFSCDDTEIINIELLADIKTMKYISVATDEQNAKCGDMLKEALPGCQINVYESLYFRNKH